MKIYLLLPLTLTFTLVFEPSKGQRTALDQFLPLYRLFRDLALGIVEPPSQYARNLRVAKNLNKLQPRLSDDVAFPCIVNNTRSQERPKSVHALRPGDIDVIGALGDSLTAGNGLLATNILQTAIENRGHSFSIGGEGTWREFVTLPNILKEFNPNLIGFSTATTYGYHKETQFNAGEFGAMSRDTPYMTKVLIKRMQTDDRINIAKDWKLISMMIGPNDFCLDMCYYKNPDRIVEAHKKDLLKVLRLLRDNLPRTIVNLIITPNLKIFANLTFSNRPPLCYFTHNVMCPCLFGLQFEHLQDRFNGIMNNWQDAQLEVANRPEFDRDDFTVVTLPFTKRYGLPRTADGLSDYSSLSEDCFHLSQKEGAKAALSIWNNLLEPVGKKSTAPFELFYFKCPSNKHPFIFTRRNSK